MASSSSVPPAVPVKAKPPRPKPSSVESISESVVPATPPLVPTPPAGPPPGKRGRVSQSISVDFAEEAESGPIDFALGNFSVILVPQNNANNPEWLPYIGLYHRVGILNGKPVWKAQDQAFAINGFCPTATAFVWFHRESNHYFLSKHPFDEEAQSEPPFWGYLDIKLMMSEDLFDWIAFPWFNKEPSTELKWMGFPEFCVERFLTNMTTIETMKNQVRNLETQLMASHDENLALKEQTVELQRALEAARDEGEEEGLPAEEPPLPPPAFPPHPPADPSAVAPLVDEVVPETDQFLTLPSGVRINRPPPVAPSMNMGMNLPSIKKTGYMAKLIAYMVATDMNLDTRVSELKATFCEFERFRILYQSHRDMIERTGNDDRFNFP